MSLPPRSVPTPSSDAVAECLAALERRIDGEVRSDLVSRVLYSTDASIYQAMPLGVVIPRSVDDVHATVEAVDLCGQVAELELVSIVSSEDDDGHGDGHTTGDIMGATMNTLDLFFQLRAERAGGGGGRVYTVTYQATDDAGNRTETSVEVAVRH